MAYVGLVVQRRLRERLRVALVTKFKPNMVLTEEFEDAFTMTREQGQELRWLGLDEREQLHWFGVTEPDPLCSRCWQQSACPREFSFPPHAHEILYGTIPLSSSVGQQLLRQTAQLNSPVSLAPSAAGDSPAQALFARHVAASPANLFPNHPATAR